MKSKTLKGISRIDSKNTHGWYVRIYGNGGVYSCKLFSDRQFGSKQKALDNAKRYRDHEQMVADLHKRDLRNKGKQPFLRKPPKNNVSGVVGVHEVKTKVNGKPVHYYQATWTENKKARSKKFYVTNKRSAEEAFKLAAEHRKQKEREMDQSSPVDNNDINLQSKAG